MKNSITSTVRVSVCASQTRLPVPGIPIGFRRKTEATKQNKIAQLSVSAKNKIPAVPIKSLFCQRFSFYLFRQRRVQWFPGSARRGRAGKKRGKKRHDEMMLSIFGMFALLVLGWEKIFSFLSREETKRLPIRRNEKGPNDDKHRANEICERRI